MKFDGIFFNFFKTRVFLFPKIYFLIFRWESVILDKLQVPFKFICQILKMGTKYLSLENTHLLHLRQTQYVCRLMDMP